MKILLLIILLLTFPNLSIGNERFIPLELFTGGEIRDDTEIKFTSANKIFGENVKELIHEQMINNYSTPGSILNLLNFANTNGVDLTQMNLKDFIKMIINEKKYKKDHLIKYLLYSFIELYFRQNVSLRNIKLLKIQNYFLKKINNTKIFNLDDETILMEFDDKVFNG